MGAVLRPSSTINYLLEQMQKHLRSVQHIQVNISGDTDKPLTIPDTTETGQLILVARESNGDDTGNAVINRSCMRVAVPEYEHPIIKLQHLIHLAILVVIQSKQ